MDLILEKQLSSQMYGVQIILEHSFIVLNLYDEHPVSSVEEINPT